MSREEKVGEQQTKYEQWLQTLGTPSLEATKAFLAGREMAEPEEGLTEEMIAKVGAKIAAANNP